jgi:hypothetical protein
MGTAVKEHSLAKASTGFNFFGDKPGTPARPDTGDSVIKTRVSHKSMERTQREGSMVFQRPKGKVDNDFNMKTPKNKGLIHRMRSPAVAVKK